VEKLRKRARLVGRLAEIVDAVTQLIKQSRISIAIAERSSAAAKVECFGPTMGRRSAFHFVICRISIVVANSLVAPAIVGAGAVGWYGATSALRAANSITRA
jgi:hypothetical protein